MSCANLVLEQNKDCFDFLVHYSLDNMGVLPEGIITLKVAHNSF